ncbi:unnamed protein product [Camellia sinensis]
MYSSIPHETLQLRDGVVIASQLPNLQEAFELFNCGNSRFLERFPIDSKVLGE